MAEQYTGIVLARMRTAPGWFRRLITIAMAKQIGHSHMG